MSGNTVQHHERSRQAFTLIEVLVVVAILALLVSSLLPSLSRARMQSASVACNSNLRQQLVAAQFYAGMYRDRLPVAKNYDWEMYTYPELTDAQYVQDAVIPYIKGNRGTTATRSSGVVAFSQVFRCPAVERSPRLNWLAAADQNHYRYNTHSAIVHSTRSGRAISFVRMPSRAVLSYDVAFPDWAEKLFPHPLSRPSLNVGYVDGHWSGAAEKEFLKASAKAKYKDEVKNSFVRRG